MKYFKFTKNWVVQVEDKDDEPQAKKLIAADPEKYLESETVTRTEYKKRKQQTDGWGTAVKHQLFGSNGEDVSEVLISHQMARPNS